MTILQLREQLISKIQITEDQDILEFMLGILVQEPYPIEPYILNAEQNKRIDIALKQIDNGETCSDEEADKITQEWLKR